MSAFSLLNSISASSNQNGSNPNEPLPTSMDDPRLNEAKEYVRSHGGNAKAAALQLCKEKMLNPGVLINQILGR
jgi:hypothetical protein